MTGASATLRLRSLALLAVAGCPGCLGGEILLSHPGPFAGMRSVLIAYERPFDDVEVVAHTYEAGQVLSVEHSATGVERITTLLYKETLSRLGLVEGRLTPEDADSCASVTLAEPEWAFSADLQADQPAFVPSDGLPGPVRGRRFGGSCDCDDFELLPFEVEGDESVWSLLALDSRRALVATSSSVFEIDEDGVRSAPLPAPTRFVHAYRATDGSLWLANGGIDGLWTGPDVSHLERAVTAVQNQEVEAVGGSQGDAAREVYVFGPHGLVQRAGDGPFQVLYSQQAENTSENLPSIAWLGPRHAVIVPSHVRGPTLYDAAATPSITVQTWPFERGSVATVSKAGGVGLVLQARDNRLYSSPTGEDWALLAGFGSSNPHTFIELTAEYADGFLQLGDHSLVQYTARRGYCTPVALAPEMDFDRMVVFGNSVIIAGTRGETAIAQNLRATGVILRRR